MNRTVFNFSCVLFAAINSGANTYSYGRAFVIKTSHQKIVFNKTAHKIGRPVLMRDRTVFADNIHGRSKCFHIAGKLRYGHTVIVIVILRQSIIRSLYHSENEIAIESDDLIVDEL